MTQLSPEPEAVITASAWHHGWVNYVCHSVVLINLSGRQVDAAKLFPVQEAAHADSMFEGDAA